MDEAVECVPQIGHADAFLHFAWRGVNRQEIDSPEVQKLNIDGSLRCIEAAKLLGCQVFMDAGSRVEYGIRLTAPWKNPWSAIGSTIWKSQACVLSTGRRSYAARCR